MCEPGVNDLTALEGTNQLNKSILQKRKHLEEEQAYAVGNRASVVSMIRP